MDETVLEQFGFRHFSYRTEPEVKSAVVTPPSDGFCEFVGDLVFFKDGGRYCSDKTFCPKPNFEDAKIYANCPTRRQKLRDRKEQL